MTVMQPADILVIGGGLAAMYAAKSAAESGADVLLLSKAPPGRSGASLVAMSVHRFAPEQDTLRADYRRRFLESAQGISDIRLAEMLFSQGAQAVSHLEVLGAPLHYKYLEQDGVPYRHLACCHPKQGRYLTIPVAEHLQTVPNLRMEKGYMAFRLAICEGRVCGVFAEKDNAVVHFPAKAVILATGGAGNVYAETTNTSDLTGDGYTMALDAGLALRDMEFVQFYPYRASSPAQFDIFPDLFAHGAIFLNERGERFMDSFPHKELENRDVLARELFRQREVRFVLDGCDREYLARECPNIYAAYQKYPQGGFLVQPAAHFFMGGVPLRPDCSTAVLGLYCCGEVTGGLHGANRIAGSALTELAVFGPIAGKEAAAYASGAAFAERTPAPPAVPEPGSDCTQALRQRIRAVMWEHASLVRSAASLERAAAALSEIESELSAQRPENLRKWLECRSLLRVAVCTVQAAAMRKESRGAHYREDCPQTDPAWTGAITVTSGGAAFTEATL